jgi:hypothetical protein
MKIILNEQEILDMALTNKKIHKKPMVTIRVLAKHYFSVGQKKKQVYDSINCFLKENMYLYAEAKWQKKLEKVISDINKSKKFDLFVVDKILIFKDEVIKIKSINNLRLEKLAFTLLIYAKIFNIMNENESNWVNSPLKDIFSDTKMTAKKVDQDIMIHNLRNLELVKTSKKIDCTNINVLFSSNSGDIAFEITDMRDFVLNYERYFNSSKFGYCSNCNRIIRLKSNKQKYCNNCKKELRKEQVKENVAKFREKTKM